jgi:uncharacterized protein
MQAPSLHEATMSDDRQPPPESLLPYDAWTEEALRHVMLRALHHVAANGLPGGHHFYLTFRTDHPGVEMPSRLKMKYPQEMTIVLQHQFWDLSIDEAAGTMGVALSFGGVPSHLRIPLAAITTFADPYIGYGLRFRTEAAAVANESAPEPAAEPAEEEKPESPQVVSLDSFRRRTPPKEQE